MKARTSAIAVAGLLAIAPVAGAQGTLEDPPTVPTSSAHVKKCGRVRNNLGGTFRVYVLHGKSRYTCKKARSVVRRAKFQHDSPSGWTYWDWTKAGGGPGPWSDIWERNDSKVVVGAIVVT
jgi:hypothetical protein